MNGTIPADFRMLFPLAPVFAVMALSLVDIPVPAQSAARDCAEDATKSSCAVGGSCCDKMPTRRSAIAQSRPKFQVKFANLGRGGVDYDAGHQMVVLHCTFEDLCPEQPVVGISEMGQIAHLQTDTGTLVEGGSGLGVISPAIHEFKNAPFMLHAAIPLAAKSLNTLHGAVTVLRACERASVAWREPFAAQIGKVRKANDFEFTLTKCGIANDYLVAEWNCKIPNELVGEGNAWNDRQLRVALLCADKSTLEAESSTQTPTTVRRIYKLNKKFPVLLDLSFVSVLKKENLHFDLPPIMLDGSKAQKPQITNAQDF